MTDQPPHSEKAADGFIEEVRRLKREAFARSGDDFDRHLERLRELERTHPGGTVEPPSTPDEKDAA